MQLSVMPRVLGANRHEAKQSQVQFVFDIRILVTENTEKLPNDSDIETDAEGFYPALDRFSAFSDGVFAIAITLLVLELPVPSAGVPLIPALVEAWPDFLGYIMSFAFIGGIWMTHSGLTRLMKRGDTVANGVNLLLLLLVALLPFSTSVMVTHLSTPDVSAAVFLYGINFFLASLTLTLLIRYIAREPSLVADDIADEQFCPVAPAMALPPS